MPANGVDLGDAMSVDEIVERLGRSVAIGRSHEWIVGQGYDDTVIGRHLTSADLDRVSTSQPVMAWHGSLHLIAVNSFALENAGLEDSTPDPPEGQYFRDDEGHLTGLLGERSALESLVVGEVESPFPHDLDSALGFLDAFVDRAHRVGITSYSDALVPPELAVAYWWYGVEKKGIRVNLMYDAKELDAIETLVSILRALSLVGYEPLSNEWLRAGKREGLPRPLVVRANRAAP